MGLIATVDVTDPRVSESIDWVAINGVLEGIDAASADLAEEVEDAIIGAVGDRIRTWLRDRADYVREVTP